jgi:aspartokinase
MQINFNTPSLWIQSKLFGTNLASESKLKNSKFQYKFLMNNTRETIGKKVRINGIKLSRELVQVNILNRFFPQDFRSLFFQRLAQHQINIPFIMISGMGEKIIGSCCVAAGDIHRIKNVVAGESKLTESLEFVPGVGTVSIFPHYSNLKLLGLVFYLFGKQRLPLYGMASSISSLTFITDYSRLDEAVNALLEYMDLPSNHAPFRPEIQVIQKKR